MDNLDSKALKRRVLGLAVLCMTPHTTEESHDKIVDEIHARIGSINEDIDSLYAMIKQLESKAPK